MKAWKAILCLQMHLINVLIHAARGGFAVLVITIEGCTQKLTQGSTLTSSSNNKLFQVASLSTFVAQIKGCEGLIPKWVSILARDEGHCGQMFQMEG